MATYGSAGRVAFDQLRTFVRRCHHAASLRSDAADQKEVGCCRAPDCREKPILRHVNGATPTISIDLKSVSLPRRSGQATGA